MRPLYIFDLDGTLADCAHRLPHIQGNQKNWPAFFAACAGDAPIPPTITTLRVLRDGGADVWVWTGRSDEARQETEAWWGLYVGDLPQQLRMRKAGDHQPDHSLKGSWLAEMTANDRIRLAAIFEDRDQVVSMWREKGLTCYQVAPGDF